MQNNIYRFRRIFRAMDNDAILFILRNELRKISIKVLNHIRADCIGNELTLYVNGQQVATATDSEFTGGDIGVIAGTFSTPGTDIHFDNFVVTRP